MGLGFEENQRKKRFGEKKV